MNAKRYNARSQAGFSLIELLVVLVILGMLAGLVLPNVMGKLSGAQAKAAKQQIIALENGVVEFRFDMGRMPERIEELTERPGDGGSWNGPYVRESLMKDPWGNDWIYQSPGQHREFDVSSHGSDGSPGGEGNAADINSWEL